MLSYLRSRATADIWCSPDQDFLAIFKPARLTSEAGTRHTFKLLWSLINMPTEGRDPVTGVGDRYHVYQIGQLHPTYLNLFTQRGVWYSVAYLCRTRNMMIDLYNEDGIQFPRGETYLLLTPDHNLVVASMFNQTIPTGVGDLCMRFYSNAFFFSERNHNDGINDRVDVQGGVVRGTAAKSQLKSLLDGYKALGYGHAYCIQDGMYKESFTVSRVPDGAYLEVVFDSTVKRHVRLPGASLLSFTSTLDDKMKYLLHYPRVAGEPQTIDFKDDISIFLTKKNAAGTEEGVLYHHNAQDSVRMVTHRDYAIPVGYVEAFINETPGFNNLGELTVNILIRKAGYVRPLVFENSRIHELYKLPDADVIDAMMGSDALVDVWQAASLEASAYTEIMRVTSEQITDEMVQRCYGYNAMGRMIAYQPIPVTDEGFGRVAKPPYAILTGGAAFEYNAGGRMVGYHQHPGGEFYPVRDSSARLVEFYGAELSESFDNAFQANGFELDPMLDYRFYASPLLGGTADPSGWEDVTGTSAYDVVNDVVSWNLDFASWYTCIRSDKNLVARTVTVNPADTVVAVTIQVPETRPESGTQVRRLEIPPATVDVWMNTRPLIEGLDYTIVWPVIYICNKHFKNRDTEGEYTNEATVTYRLTGFCTEELELEPIAEHGFVEYGLLSRNNRFNVRDDKVLRVVAGGRMYTPNTLAYAEDHSGIYLNGLPNGTPYQIQNVTVPLHGLVNGETTYSERTKAEVVDEQVSDYLTLKLPQPEFVPPSPITQRYDVYSLFLSKVIYELNAGYKTDEELMAGYTDQDIQDWMAPFEYLLPADPAHKGVNDNYVIVTPHYRDTPIGMSAWKYALLKRVNELYLDGKVNLSPYITVELN